MPAVYCITSRVGVGSFLDPREGNGGRVNCGLRPGENDYIKVSDQKQGMALDFHLPPIDVCVLNARFADSDGNVYFHDNVTVTESFDAAYAAKRHGGKVFVSVQCICEMTHDQRRKLPSQVPWDTSLVMSTPSNLMLPASVIDGICVNRSPFMLDPMGFVDAVLVQDHRVLYSFASLPKEPININHTYFGLRFVNKLLRITPVRTSTHVIVARLAAQQFASAFTFDQVSKKMPFLGKYVIGTIGVGLPEEVCLLLYRAGLCEENIAAQKNDLVVAKQRHKITLCTESGALGGLPGMGVCFGASINPIKILSEAEMSRLLSNHLQATCLGALQVDVCGNVNVSCSDVNNVEKFIGVGGFSNFVDAACNIIFMFNWTTDATLTVSDPTRNVSSSKKNDDDMRRLQPYVTLKTKGTCKLVKKVDQVTFCSKTALENGQSVMYCTQVGLFRLDSTGSLELVAFFNGIDIQRDVLDLSGCTIKIAPDVKMIEASVLTGRGFQP